MSVHSSNPQHDFTFIQRIFIKKYNYLLKKIGIKEYLDPEGVCSGLSILFMHYSQQGKQAEFLKFLQAVQQITKEEAIKVTHGGSIYFEGEEYNQSDLIAFADKIKLVHSPDDYGLFQRSFKKLVGGNWDNTVSFVASLENTKNLQAKLKRSMPSAGTYYVTFPGHAVCIVANNDGTYTYFDSNKFNPELNKNLTLPELVKRMVKTGNDIIKTLNLQGPNLTINVDNVNFKQKDENVAEAGFKYIVKELGNMEKFPDYYKHRIHKIFRQAEMGNIPSLSALKNIRNIIQEAAENGVKEYAYLQEEITRFIGYYVSSEKVINFKSLEEYPIFSEKQKKKYAELLFGAVQTRDIDTVKFLLNKGVSPNFTGKGGYTALHLAVNRNDYEMVKLLLSYPNLQINRKFQGKVTAFDHAVQEGHTDIIELMLKDKRLEKRINIDLKEPLKKYIKNGNMLMVESLLKLGDTTHISESSEEIVTPLQVALQYNNKLAIKSLLKAGADVKKENGRVQSLMYASKIEERYLSLSAKNMKYYFFNAALGVNKKLVRFVKEIRKDKTVDDVEEYQRRFENLFQKIPKFLRKFTSLDRYREELQDEIIFNKAGELIRELEEKRVGPPDMDALVSESEKPSQGPELSTVLESHVRKKKHSNDQKKKKDADKSDSFDDYPSTLL